jgi:hypothetical protein
MAKICLVSCAKTKRLTASPAEELYVSQLFSYARGYAQSTADRWYILSAKHGLLAPEAVIGPYEETLKEKSVAEQRRWSEQVLTSLRAIISPADEVIFLAGVEYRRFLVEGLQQFGCKVHVPLEGMPIGVQIKWLRGETRQSPPLLLERLYELLRQLEVGLGGKRRLQSCTGAMAWPQRGVYFFFEPGEFRAAQPSVERVVRVGTHAVGEGSTSTLWSRLHTHRGSVVGGGYHRGSIFRLHVGAALLQRDDARAQVPTWGRGSTAPAEARAAEVDLERRVSAYIGAMSVLWLAVEDAPGPRSDRAYIERNVIALLSRTGRQVDPPSQQWLGNYSPHEPIRQSGLWNIQWVEEVLDPRVLEVFERYIEVTLGRKPHPRKSIAPTAPWEDAQLLLFRK